MDKTVARLNIEHYRKLLANETDETRRRSLQHLLAEEEAKLARLEGNPPQKNSPEPIASIHASAMVARRRALWFPR